MRLMISNRKSFLISAAVCLIVGIPLISCTVSKLEDSRTHNSDHFDLSNWKLTLPVAGEKGKAEEVKKLKAYESAYFYDAPDGAMVFYAPTEGSTTKNSKYPRSELRERMNGEDAEWKLAQGGTLTATLRIDEAPTTSEGKPGKMVIGQIHGEDDELIRLYWDKRKIYFKNDISGKDGKEHKFRLKAANGNVPNVALGEMFSYKIEAYGDTLSVTVYADGNEYHSVTPINDAWQSDTLYFKAGVYLGVNSSQGASGAGKVSFYALDVAHTQGSGLGGLKPLASPIRK